MADRRNAERAGRWAETLAGLYLRAKGFSIVATRFRTPIGEIDIVARRGRLLVFAEVKQRTRADDLGMTLEAIRTERIVRAAEWFLSTRPRYGGFDCRFDVIFLAPGRWPYHLVNAFGAN